MSRITEILKQKKLQGFGWDDLSDHLPITSAGLRAAFSRGSVSEIYLEVLEKVLKIDVSTTSENTMKVERNEKESTIYQVIERIVHENVLKEIQPLKEQVESIRQDMNIIFMKELENAERKANGLKDESGRKTS